MLTSIFSRKWTSSVGCSKRQSKANETLEILVLAEPIDNFFSSYIIEIKLILVIGSSVEAEYIYMARRSVGVLAVCTIYIYCTTHT